MRASDAALFSGFMLTIWRSRWRESRCRYGACANGATAGGWQRPAAVAVGFVVLRIIVDTARDPTSHNLWPFEIVIVSALSLVTIAVLKVLRRFMGADDASAP